MIRISNIRMPLDYQPEQLEKKVCKLLRTRSGIQAIHLVKQSVDARKKSLIFLGSSYSTSVDSRLSIPPEKLAVKAGRSIT